MDAENAMAEEVEEEFTEETQADEEETTDEDQAPEAEEDEEPPWFKKRFDKITYQREQERRDKEAALAKAQELAEEKIRLAEELEKVKNERLKTDGRPKLEDFETDEDFYDALTEWKWDQREAKAKELQAKENETKTRQQKEAEFAERVANTNKSGKKKYKDYEQVVFSLPGDVMSNEMAQALFETVAPEDIAYHLGKNPSEAAKIAKLSPLKKAIALGKIEERLTNKKTTNAPPPISPVKGKSSSTFDPDKLLAENPQEWIRLRNEGKI